jgi:hypothetical protein
VLLGAKRSFLAASERISSLDAWIPLLRQTSKSDRWMRARKRHGGPVSGGVAAATFPTVPPIGVS